MAELCKCRRSSDGYFCFQHQQGVCQECALTMHPTAVPAVAAKQRVPSALHAVPTSIGLDRQGGAATAVLRCAAFGVLEGVLPATHVSAQPIQLSNLQVFGNGGNTGPIRRAVENKLGHLGSSFYHQGSVHGIDEERMIGIEMQSRLEIDGTVMPPTVASVSVDNWASKLAPGSSQKLHGSRMRSWMERARRVALNAASMRNWRLTRRSINQRIVALLLVTAASIWLLLSYCLRDTKSPPEGIVE